MNQALFENINIGDELTPVVKAIDQDQINRYAEASGDYNPLHIDPEFARQTRFGGTIAHGMMTLAFISQMMTDQLGYSWIENGELDVSFLAPVRPGDLITARGRVIEKNVEDQSITWQVWCENQEGQKVVVGKARICFPL